MNVVRSWMSRLFDLSPSMIIVAVMGSLLAAFTLIIYGFLRVLYVIWELVSERDLSDKQEGHLSIEFIELIDVFLIGVILLIVALGLYQLFVDEKTTLPSWLRIRTLDELKHRLIGVICVVLGVNFLSNVSEWSGGTDILYLGIAIGIVLLALVFLLKAVDDSIQEEVHLLREEREERELAKAPEKPAGDRAAS
ncbi:MAG: YqhA family protein [Thermomicrobiales bacterium]|nr:YqhA family protein [Thermomicrobiales bacterium]